MKTILTLCALAICGAFTLQAADGDKPKKPGDAKPGEGRRNPEETFKKLDTNSDGSITKDEFMAGPFAKDKERAEKMFTARDKNTDGKLTKEEWIAEGGRPGKPGDAPKKPGDAPKKPEGDKK